MPAEPATALRLTTAAGSAIVGLLVVFVADDATTVTARYATTAVGMLCLTAAWAFAPLPRPVRFAGGALAGLALVGLAVRVLVELGQAQARTSATAVLGTGLLALGGGFVAAWTVAALHWQRRRHPPSLRRLAATSHTLDHLAGRVGLSPDETRGLLRRHRIPPPAVGRPRR